MTFRPNEPTISEISNSIDLFVSESLKVKGFIEEGWGA